MVSKEPFITKKSYVDETDEIEMCTVFDYITKYLSIK